MYTFTVIRTHLGTATQHETHITFDAPQRSLVARGLRAMSRASRTRQISSTTVSQLRRLLASVSANTRHLLTEEAENFDEARLNVLLRSAFNDLERRSACSLSAKQQLFKALITCLSYVDPPLLSGNFQQWAAEQMPRFRRAPRIRDIPLLEVIPQSATSSASPFVSASASLNSAHNAIEDACRQELLHYRELLIDQDELLEAFHRSPLLPDEKNANCNNIQPLTPLHAKSLAKFIQQAEAGKPFPATPFNLLTSLRQRYHSIHKDARQWLLARYRPPNSVLHAIFVLIALRTGWNPQSVASLNIDDIDESPDGTLLLQSAKFKTDDGTPPVAVRSGDKLARQAIELLRLNLDWGLRLGMVNEGEKRLWIGWTATKKPRTIVADGYLLRSFIDRYKLSKFRLKDLRALRASMAYAAHRDLDQVRLILGHKSFSSIDAYLRSTIIFKMNEANILAFQRRAELEVPSMGEFADTEFSVGDGGFCVDPTSARFGSRALPCDGLSCQVGGTCKNYRFRPSKSSVQDAIRTLESYKACWQALSELQPDALWDVHLPRVIYIHVMLKAIYDLRPDLLPEGYE